MNAKTHLLFDTLAYTNLLQDSGFTNVQTEALTRAQCDSLRHLIDTHLATKEDLNQLRHDTTLEIRDIQHKIELLAHQIDRVFFKAVLSLGGMIGIATAVIACFSKL